MGDNLVPRVVDRSQSPLFDGVGTSPARGLTSSSLIFWHLREYRPWRNASAAETKPSGRSGGHLCSN
jgi:hypothetical protein